MKTPTDTESSITSFDRLKFPTTKYYFYTITTISYALLSIDRQESVFSSCYCSDVCNWFYACKVKTKRKIERNKELCKTLMDNLWWL